MDKNCNKNIRKRKTDKIKLVFLMFGLWSLLFGLSLRLIWIMVFKGEEYSSMAREQWTSEIKVYGKRGKILDRN
ncbi:MAG: hypothetical protein ACRC7R_00575, partial [Sarcina sp.]